MTTYQAVLQVGPEPGDCVGDSFGQVQQFLSSQGPCSLTRSLYSGRVDDRPVTISVATLTLANSGENTSLVNMSTQNGTGDVRTLVYDGEGYAGSPSTWADDPTFLATVDAKGEVEILEVMWADGGATHELNPSLMKLLDSVAPYVASQ